MISPGEVPPAGAQVIALIPVQGLPLYHEKLGGRTLLAHTIQAAKASRAVQRIIVSTEDDRMAELAKREGAEAPFLRPKELASSDVPLEKVLQHAVEWLEKSDGKPVEVVVLLEVTHPFRPPGLIDKIVETLFRENWDSVFVAHEERANFWCLQGGGLARISGPERGPRTLKSPLYREISGLVCATRGEIIKRGERLGHRVGMVPIRDLSGLVDVRTQTDLEIAERLLPKWESLCLPR